MGGGMRVLPPEHEDEHCRWQLVKATLRSEGGDKRLAEAGCGQPCRMAGRRAPEMANEQLHTMLASMADRTSSSVLSVCARAAISPELTAKILNDFYLGLARVRLVCAQKFGVWNQLPWKLCGLAHREETAARRCAARAVELFEGPRRPRRASTTG